MSFLSKINKHGGVVLFNSPNTLTYSLFNFLYNKLIINLKGADEDILSFHKNGYLKSRINLSKEIDELKKILNENDVIEKNKATFGFKLNNQSRIVIKKLLGNPDFLKLKKRLENYFNLKMSLININVTRNFNIPEDEEHKVKFYSNNYHVDFYLMNYFKIFINLHDVDEKKGPMYLYSKSDTKKFVKKNNFIDRNNYAVKNEKELGLVKNIGKKGDVFICSTPQCLHRASSPAKGQHRDMLFLSFALSPEIKKDVDDIFFYEKEYEDSIWNNSSELRKKLCKPKSFRKQIKMFIKFAKFKLV